jgi:hypothetical protein
MRKVFINLLIGWKAFDLGSLSIMFGKFMQLIEQLTAVLQIPPYVLRNLLYPLVLICQVAERFDIDLLYNLFSVTCQGAKAPIDLSSGGFRTLHDFTVNIGKRSLVSISQFLVDEEKQLNLQLLEVPNFKGLAVEPTDYIIDQLQLFAKGKVK